MPLFADLPGFAIFSTTAQTLSDNMVSFLVVFARWLVCDIDGHKQCDTADVTDVATADIRRWLPVLCVVTDGYVALLLAAMLCCELDIKSRRL